MQSSPTLSSILITSTYWVRNKTWCMVPLKFQNLFMNLLELSWKMNSNGPGHWFSVSICTTLKRHGERYNSVQEQRPYESTVKSTISRKCHLYKLANCLRDTLSINVEDSVQMFWNVLTITWLVMTHIKAPVILLCRCAQGRLRTPQKCNCFHYTTF